MKKDVSTVLWKLFLAVYAIVLVAVLVLCVMETQERVPANLMTWYPFAGILAITIMAFIGIKIEPILEKYEKYLLLIFFAVYVIVTVRFTLHSRSNPTNDSASLVNGAYYIAGLTENMEWEYFARWSNNVMPMIFLGIVFRIAALVGISDVYYLALALNILQVVVTLYCTFQLCKRYSKHGVVAGWLGMGMMAIYVPIWGHTQSLYTDAFSFGLGIIAFYIWLCNYEKRKSGWKYWAVNIAAGFIWSIGYQIKATVVISMFAVILYLVLYSNWKVLFKNLVCLLAPLLLIGVICSNYKKTLPTMEHQDTWAYPVIEYFIGLGLEADGSFRLDSEFFLTLGSIWGMDEKKAYAMEFIIENIDQLWNVEHVVAKLRHNFASGKMKADDFMQDCDSHGFLYNCISHQGEYRRTYRTYVTAYWYMLLEFIVIACVLRGSTLKENSEKENPAVFVPIVSVCGIMLYVMLFEANNRQLYNHIPMFFASASIGIWSLQNKLELFIFKLKEKTEAKRISAE